MTIRGFRPLTRNGDDDYQGERHYTRTYVVFCDSFNDQEPDIYAHPDCPKFGERADWDTLAFVTKRKAVYRPKSRYIWDLTIEASSIRLMEYIPGQNPLQDPAVATAHSEISLEDLYLDQDGLPVTNACGDLVALKQPLPRMVFRVKKNVALVNGWLSSCSGIVNTSDVYLKGVPYPRGTLMLWSVDLGENLEKNKIGYMVADLTIKHKAEGWGTGYLNQGFYELVDHPTNVAAGKFILFDKATGKPLMVRHRCLDGIDGYTGNPETEPVFLDINGKRPRVPIWDGNQKKWIYAIKKPLQGSDIVVLQRRGLTYFDFNNLLPIK